MGDVIYLKLKKKGFLRGEALRVGELALVSCTKSSVENRIRALRFPTAGTEKQGRYVYDVMDVIRVILREFPSAEINSLGEQQIILIREKRSNGSQAAGWIKTILICLLCFFGAGFSIMAFNNDVGTTILFRQLYQRITGIPSDGFTVLEISYCIGVGMGMLVFFHHFTRRRGISDPTPLEIEMRTYEDEVDQTLIGLADQEKEKE